MVDYQDSTSAKMGAEAVESQHSCIDRATRAPAILAREDSNALSLLRLCQLVSPALPIGAYHFSQGLEYAVHAGWIRDEDSAHDWISGVAHGALATLDLPVLLRLFNAWQSSDAPAVQRWSQFLIASRETAELRAEERHMGKALAKVLVELDIECARGFIASNHCTYASMFALAACRWSIDCDAMLQAYLWTWTENQVLASLKLLPVGQSAGQRILNRILPLIPGLVTGALVIADEDIGISTPHQSLASSRHETQYSRLFRS